jgi:predicted dienelactone hydrolase
MPVSPRRLGRRLLTASLALLSLAAHAIGLATLPATAEDGPVTLHYPSTGTERPVRRGPFVQSWDVDGGVAPGNGRLVVISHGSGGAPWVHADLVRRLVEQGFVVALPEHRADNHHDGREQGPQSWTRRPAEVSRAIDAVGRDPRFQSLRLDKVGVYGMSAGGHTALTLAGGRWSPAGFSRHCEAHLTEDFHFCVGLHTRLSGNMFDNLKQWVALAVIRHRYAADDTPRTDTDPRVAVVVAGVPAAADFDPASLATLSVPTGLVTARDDRWLSPRFHSDRVLSLCAACAHLADLPKGGHGALLSPLPPHFTGLLGDLLNDPAGFDRQDLMAIDQRIGAFLARHLLGE